MIFDNDIIPINATDPNFTVAGDCGTPIDFDATTIDPLSVRFGIRDEVWNETGDSIRTVPRAMDMMSGGLAASMGPAPAPGRPK